METEPVRSPQAQREVNRNTLIRRARTCYDHLAGVAGVELFGELVRRGWIAEADGGNHPPVNVTSVGKAALAANGVDVERVATAKRRLAYGCMDWTERRHHLGGALGAEVLRALERAGRVRRFDDGRTVDAMGPIGEWLDG